MPGRHCAVAVCKNNSVVTKLNNESILFHRFPKIRDVASKTIRGEWVRRCRRAAKFNPDTSQICSVHFCETDYERDLQNELLGLPTKRLLKRTAVPTLHLGIQERSSDSAVQRNARAAVKRRKLEIKNALSTNTESSCMEIESPATKKGSNQHWKNKYQQLLADYKELRKKYEQNKQHLLEIKKKLRSRITYYKNKFLKMKVPDGHEAMERK